MNRESSDPSFWEERNASRNKIVTKQLSYCNRLLDRLKMWDNLKEECSFSLELIKEIIDTKSGDDDMIETLASDCTKAITLLLEDNEKFELELLLNGQYDDKPARMTLTAGVGGTEACDWVDMLLRMYMRHAEKMGYSVTIEEKTPGDVVGYKSAELIIEGSNAYGWFRGEKGAHRLVRLSPFNANNKRQTTFGGVDVVPILDDEEVNSIEVPESALEITTMRSGGKGGQNVSLLI